MGALTEQVGGNHYKELKMQPIVLIVKAGCDFIQGNIIKYVTRHRYKNGKEDINKCIHYAHLAMELLPEKREYLNTGLAYSYALANSLTTEETNVIVATLQRDFLGVIQACGVILKKEY